MNTASVKTDFSAFSDRELAVVRIEGPGTCRESGRFENLLQEVERRGFRTLVVDLADCPRMDSTFAGALLRLAARVESASVDQAPLRVVLAGARGTVAELLDTLCVSSLLEAVPLPEMDALPQLDIADRNLSKEDIIALSLDGHERLAALNDQNARRFAALLPMLRRELEKAKSTPSESGETGTRPPGDC